MTDAAEVTGANEFDQLRHGLFERLEALNDYSGKSNAFIAKAYDYIDATRSTDTLRIFDRLMLEQNGNVYKLFLLNQCITVLRSAFGNEVNSVFTQEHIERASSFDYALNQRSSAGGEIFPDVESMERKVAYMEAMRGAVILGDNNVVDYFSSRFDSIAKLTVEHDIIDPKLLLEIINSLLKGSSAALVDGTL